MREPKGNRNMNTIRIFLSAVLVVVAGCASNPGGRAAVAPAGGSEQIESAQVDIGQGVSGLDDYEEMLSNPGPF